MLQTSCNILQRGVARSAHQGIFRAGVGNTLQHTATRCNTLCNTLQHNAEHCSTLQHTAHPGYPDYHPDAQKLLTHYNTLRYTATRYSTLQHTAPPCTVLLHHATTGWRKLIGSPKLQIIFHKRATKYRSLLQKMTYKHKGSSESSPPCTSCYTLQHTYCTPCFP